MDSDYLVIGSGPGGATVARELARAGKSVRILERGRDWRNSPLYGTYAGAILYVGLSRLLPPINVEGFGISFVEAAASGLPSVAGDSGGVRSAVRDGEAGLVVVPEDVAQAAGAIRRLLDDDVLRRRMGAAARQAALGRFNWDRVARDTIDFAADCVARVRNGT